MLEKVRSSDTAMLGLLFAAALLFRLTYLFQIQSLPFTHHLGLDADSYDHLAKAIAGGDWLGDRVFYQAPLYPYFLAVLYKVFGHNLNLVRMVQLSLGAFNCVVVAWMARRIFDRKTAFWAGWLTAGCGILVFYEGAIGKDGLSVLMTTIVLAGLVWSFNRRLWYGWLLSGAALGCAVLTRGNLLLLLPLIILWIALVLKEQPVRQILGAIAALVAGTTFFILPVTFRNYVVGQDFVLTTSQAGQNFYIGNNPRASGFFENPPNVRLNPKYEEADFRAEALRRTNRTDMKPSEVSGFWFKEGIEFIRSNPGKAAGLFLTKTAMFWNHFEIPDNYNYYFVRKEVFILPLLFVGFGIVAPLGLFGLFLARKRPCAWLFILFVFGYMLSIVPFHVASRYRLPIVPVLILFTAHAVARAVDEVRARRLNKLALGLVPVAVLAFLVNWRVVDEEGTFKTPLTELGIIAAEAGESDKALAYYEKALEIDPRFSPALYNMGNALADQNRLEEAITAYRKALDIDPEFLMAYENLGKSYIRTGRLGKALQTFDKALSRRPDFAGALAGKGIVYHLLEDFHGAVALYKKALAIEPDSASTYYNLACAHARLGAIQDAGEALKRAVELNPEFEEKAKHDPDLADVR